jgi:hypothetical protein
VRVLSCLEQEMAQASTATASALRLTIRFMV